MLSSFVSNKQRHRVGLSCSACHIDGLGGGGEGWAGGVTRISITGNVTCPSLITFFPLIRCWRRGAQGRKTESHCREDECW